MLPKGRTTPPAAPVACLNGVDAPEEMCVDEVDACNGVIKFMFTCPPPTDPPPSIPSIRSTAKGGGAFKEEVTVIGVSAVTSCLLVDAICCCWRNSDVANCFMAEFYEREVDSENILNSIMLYEKWRMIGFSEKKF